MFVFGQAFGIGLELILKLEVVLSLEFGLRRELDDAVHDSIYRV
jgi:hypothetical protein